MHHSLDSKVEKRMVGMPMERGARLDLNQKRGKFFTCEECITYIYVKIWGYHQQCLLCFLNMQKELPSFMSG